MISALAEVPTGIEADGEWDVLTAGDMIEGRYNHTTNLIPGQDKVIAVGGTSDGYGSLSSAEIFDRESLSWRSASSMSSPRMRHTTDEIDPGRIIVIGGFLGGTAAAHPSLFKHFKNTGSISYSSTEIYDAFQDRWIPGPELNIGRFWHSTAALPDGDIIVVGGINATEGALAECEIYDRSLGKFIPAAPMNVARTRFTINVLADGTILVAGGHNGLSKSPYDSCELYIPGEDRWITASSMNRHRGYHSSALLPDGRVMVSGGFSSPTTSDWTDSEIYDPSDGEWTMAGNMAYPRHNHISMMGWDGALLVIGGSNCETGMCHSGIEKFHLESGEWSDTELLIIGRKWCRADMLPGGDVLVSGGKACNYPEASTELLTYNFQGDREGSDDGGGNGRTYVLVIFLAISFIMVNILVKSHIRK
ncbi:MAG: Kelch repeat-containing protein [Thermoplasmatota archaeon]